MNNFTCINYCITIVKKDNKTVTQTYGCFASVSNQRFNSTLVKSFLKQPLDGIPPQRAKLKARCVNEIIMNIQMKKL